jgi:hypothetical protein
MGATRECIVTSKESYRLSQLFLSARNSVALMFGDMSIITYDLTSRYRGRLR